MKKNSHKKKDDASKEQDPTIIPVQSEESQTEADEQAAGAPVAVENDIEQLKQDNAVLTDRLMRLQADFDNYRKRMQREALTAGQRSLENLLLDLLPVLDHFEMGLKTAIDHQTHEAVIEGFKLVYDQLQTSLKKVGLSPIDAEGQPFDPNIHEAMTHAPSEEYDADIVSLQTRRGYKLGDKVLRAAQVVVSSGPTTVQSEQNECEQEEESS